METDKKSNRIHLMRLDTIRRSSNRKELIWIKTNTEKKVDKVLPGELFVFINFNVKALTRVNSQQIWMNFNTFPNSSRVNCVIRINFNSDAVHKGWKLL